MMRQQAESTLPAMVSTDDAAVYSMNQEEADELFEQLSLHLAEHGESDHRTKAVIARIEQLGLTIQFAMDKARMLDKNFGVDKPVAKGTKDLSGGGTDNPKTEGVRGKAVGTGAGAGDATESKPKPTGGGTADAAEKAGKPIGGGTSKR